MIRSSPIPPCPPPLTTAADFHKYSICADTPPHSANSTFQYPTKRTAHQKSKINHNRKFLQSRYISKPTESRKAMQHSKKAELSS